MNISLLKEKLKKNRTIKSFIIKLISPSLNPRPRLWVRLLVNPCVHKKGKGCKIRLRRSRIDVFPWNKFNVGDNVLIEDFTTINNGAGDVIIGNNSRIGIGSVIIGPVTLGNKVGLGQHVFIAGFNHGYADASIDSNEQDLVKSTVIIEDESHIGSNSVILAGVHIGTRVQIGAGSVVTKDIPSYCVAVGNPARVIKKFDFQKKEWVRM